MGSGEKPMSPARDAVATMAPPPRSTMAGTSARTPKNTPSTLTPVARR